MTDRVVEGDIMTSVSGAAVQAGKPTLERQAVHDLRNLFAVVASAKQLLERGPEEARRRSLLDALEDAADRGDRLTTRLLANERGACGARPIDVGLRLADLSPMMQASGVAVELDAEISAPNSMVRVDGDELDAVMLELLANAVSAGARNVVVRCRTIGARIWLMVRDDGRGMSAAQVAEARNGQDRAAAHGNGLRRVHQFAAVSHGRVHMRARPGAGTCVALTLPTLLTTARPNGKGDRLRTRRFDMKTTHSRPLVA